MTGILNALLGFLKPGGAGFTIIQTFTSSTTWICPAGVTEVEYLVVAGGGGGGGGTGGAGENGGAGGGAGGFRTGTGFSVTAGTSYTVTIGAGGARFTNGGDSVFSTITSTGGGKGGQGSTAAGSDGSGGGGGGAGGSVGSGNTPSVSPSQGNAGGLVS